MLEVFKRILMFSGPEIDIDEFLNLIEDIQNPSLFKAKEASIQQQLKKKPNLQLWYDFTQACLLLYQIVVELYEKETNKACGADVAAPLFAELLPHDNQDLDALAYKINQIYDKGIRQKFLGWFLITINSAIVIKKSGAAEGDLEKAIFESVAKQILEKEQAKETETCKALFLPVKNACAEYKAFLFAIIADYFQQKFPAIYKTYFSGVGDKDEAFQILYLHIQKEKPEVKNALTDDSIRIIFEKYSAILMIHYALEKPNPTHITLATFAEAHFLNKQILEKKHTLVVNAPAPTNANTGIWKLAEFFKRPETPEEKFLRLAEPLSKQIKAENDAYFAVRGEYLNQVNAALKP